MKKLVCGFLFLVCAVFVFSEKNYVSAEGSADIVNNGGYRPYLEYFCDGSTTAGIERKTIVNVYLEKGDRLYLGSSVYNSVLDESDVKQSAVTGSDIVIEMPDGVKMSFDVIQNGQGHIQNVSQETAGPRIDAADTQGYIPYIFTPEHTGIYKLSFHSQTGVNSNPTCKGVKEVWSQSASTVAAWDATIVGADGEIRRGRIFTKCLALNIGANGKSLNSCVYVVTTDGYIYETDFNGMCPYGFVFYANNRGLVSTENNYSLYQSFVSNNNQLSDLNNQGATYHNPWNSDSQTDRTFNIFFARPDPELEGILYPTAYEPETASNLSFVGSKGNNQTHVGYGGYFKFDIENASNATISVDLSNVLTSDGTYKNYGVVKLSNPVTPGTNYFYWDGCGADGTIVPVGSYDNSAIKVSVETHSGEYHFPLLDVEMAANGIKVTRINAIYRETTDSNGVISKKDVSDNFEQGKSLIYYNNKKRLPFLSSYANPSKTIADNLDFSDGTDSADGAMKFGMSGSYYKGDQTALDIWTYSNNEIPVTTVLQTPIIINDDLFTAVSGCVFYDKDKNKAFNLSKGDYLLSDIEVRLSYSYTDENDVAYNESAVAYTDSAGMYRFFGIPVMDNGNITTCNIEIIKPMISYTLTTGGVSTNELLTTGTEKQTVKLGGKDSEGNILYSTDVSFSDAGYYYERISKAITIKKDWVTDISSDPLRPKSALIKIRSFYMDGPVKNIATDYSYTLSNANRWTFTDTSLPAYSDESQTYPLNYEIVSETYTMREEDGQTYYVDAGTDDTLFPYSTDFTSQDSIESTILTVVNAPKKGTMQIIKRDEDDKSLLLDGVEFVLWEKTDLTKIPDTDSEMYKEYSSAVYHRTQTAQTNQNGVLVFPDLDMNSYFFVETAAKSGYAPDSSVYEFSVSSDNLHMNTTVYNYKLSISAQKTVFIKPDSYNPTGIAGVSLYDAYSALSTDNSGTDENSYDKRKAVLAGDTLIYSVRINAKGYDSVTVNDTLPAGCSVSDINRMKVYRQQTDTQSGQIQYLEVTEVSDAVKLDNSGELIWRFSVQDGYEYYAEFEAEVNSMAASADLTKLVNKANVLFEDKNTGSSNTLITNTVSTDLIHLYFYITKTIEEPDPSQVFLFRVERFADEKSSVPESVFYTSLHGNSANLSKLVQVDRRGYYKVTEVTDWSSTYYDFESVSFKDISGRYLNTTDGMYTVLDRAAMARQPRSSYDSSALPSILGISDFPAVSFSDTQSRYAYVNGHAYAENKFAG